MNLKGACIDDMHRLVYDDERPQTDGERETAYAVECDLRVMLEAMHVRQNKEADA